MSLRSICSAWTYYECITRSASQENVTVQCLCIVNEMYKAEHADVFVETDCNVAVVLGFIVQ